MVEDRPGHGIRVWTERLSMISITLAAHNQRGNGSRLSEEEFEEYFLEGVMRSRQIFYELSIGEPGGNSGELIGNQNGEDGNNHSIDEFGNGSGL